MKIRQTKKSIIWSIVTIVVLVVCDQLSKIVAQNALSNDFIIIEDVLQLHYLENTGAAFSILTGQTWVFYITTPILCIAILYFFLQIPVTNKKYIWLQIICIMLFAGAIGNYIDRIRLHYVIDFIYFSLINFPVFNVADIYVTVSAFLLFFLVLFYYKDDELKVFFKDPPKDKQE